MPFFNKKMEDLFQGNCRDTEVSIAQVRPPFYQHWPASIATKCCKSAAYSNNFAS